MAGGTKPLEGAPPGDRHYGTRLPEARRLPAGLAGFLVDNSEATPASSSTSSARPQPRPYDPSIGTDHDDLQRRAAERRRGELEDPELVAMMEDMESEAAGASSDSAPPPLPKPPAPRPLPSQSSSSSASRPKEPALPKSKSTSGLNKSSLSRSKVLPLPSVSQKKMPAIAAPSSSKNGRSAARSASPSKTSSSTPKITTAFARSATIAKQTARPGPAPSKAKAGGSSASATSSALLQSTSSRASSAADSHALLESAEERDDNDDNDVRGARGESQPGDDISNPIDVLDESQSSQTVHRRKDGTKEGALKAARKQWDKAQQDEKDRIAHEEAGREDEFVPTGRRASRVYLYFDTPYLDKQGRIAYDCLCHDPPYTAARPFTESSTSTLLAHIRGKPDTQLHQTTLEASFAKRDSSLQLSKSEVRQMYAAWVSESCRPAAIVEDEGFRRFLSEDMRKLVPSRWTDADMSCRVRCANHILNLVSKAIIKGFCGTTKTSTRSTGGDDADVAAEDEWAIGIDEDDFTGATEAERAETLGLLMEEDDMAISSALNPDAVKVDEDEDELAAILAESESRAKSSPELHKALQARNNNIGIIVKKLAWLASKLRFSPVMRARFQTECRRMGCKEPHTIRRDVATRWYSTHDMMSDGTRLWNGIIAFLERSDCKVPKDKRLKRTDEADLVKLHSLLVPIAAATLRLSVSAAPTIGEVIGLFEELDRRFVDIKEAEDEQVWKQAAWTKEWQNTAINKLKEDFSKYYAEVPRSENDARAEPVFDMDKLDPMTRALMKRAKEKRNQATPDDIIDEWLADITPLSEDGKRVDPLRWWWDQLRKGNDRSGLANFALDVFGCPGRVVTPLRHKLRAPQVAHLVTVGKWFQERAVPDDLLSEVLQGEQDDRRAKRKAKADRENELAKRPRTEATEGDDLDMDDLDLELDLN
ncbi:hypothetical protein V8E36_009700 [Tilletia maclaganii]